MQDFSLPSCMKNQHVYASMLTKCVKVWMPESVEELRGCFECTEWEVFLNACNTVSEATDVVSSYISFCEDLIIPQKKVKIFPNNKPWITKSLKATLNKKKIAFQTGNKTDRKSVQKVLVKEIKEQRKVYKEKVESQFQQGNMADAWTGLKALTGQTKASNSATVVALDEQKEFSEKLNEFYCRFERDDLKDELQKVIGNLYEQLHNDCSDVSSETENYMKIEAQEVETLFRKLKTKKAVGPDNISGRILKSCASQLCNIFSQLFSWSVIDCCVPDLWKKSVICPVPKKSKPVSLNDYRPVALTSIVMKCFERLILKQIILQTASYQDPNQFAYKLNRSTDDATLTLLHNAYSHLEKTGSFVRILFIDFSSAFNTIQPHLMALKLLSYDVSPHLVLWIISFLVNRSQSVRFQQAISSVCCTSTGSPQGTVLSPVLFTLYTNDCTGNSTTPLVKYSDDSALQDLSNSHSMYCDRVNMLATWCKDNYLELNVQKTKEMLIDFRKNPQNVPDLYICGEKVERVSEYKYLGTIIDDKLNFTANTNLIYRKCQSRIFCLQKLRSLNVNTKVLQGFYRCFIEAILTFSFICWYGNLSVRSKNVLNRVVKVCSKIVGERQSSLNVLYEERAFRKAQVIVSDNSHGLSQYYELLPSGRRYRTPKFRLLRTKKSFIPMSIQFLNK